MFKYLTQQCNLVTQGPSPEQDHCSSQTLEKLSNISVIPTVGMKALFWKPLWHKVPRNPKSQNLNNFASIALQVLGQDQSLPSSSFAKISTLTFLQKQKRIPFFFFFCRGRNFDRLCFQPQPQSHAALPVTGLREKENKNI